MTVGHVNRNVNKRRSKVGGRSKRGDDFGCWYCMSGRTKRALLRDRIARRCVSEGRWAA